MILWIVSLVLSALALTGLLVSFLHFWAQQQRIPEAAKSKHLEAKVAELEVASSGLKQEIDEGQAKRLQLVEEMQLARVENERHQREKSDAQQWLRENEQKVRKIDEWRTLIETYEGEAEKCRLELENKQDGLSDLNVELKKRERELREIDENYNDLKQRRTVIQSDVERIESEKNESQANLSQLKSELAKVTDDLAAIRTNRETALTDLQESRAEFERLRSERDNLKADIVETTSKLRQLEREKQITEESVLTFKEVLNNLSTRVDTFQKAITPPSAKERLQDFERPVLGASALGDATLEASGESGERSMLERLASELDSRALVFHPRTLHAFHTSLKIAEVSPMVVLAGISGTGKSLLPRVYSEVMGMHFLNVAVQPRWDSPQDLLGFYNYMEHRYKATDLARALRQMDGYNYPAEGDEAEKVQKGMLLVLLDEMNLARVEYYFSDLLSKLEMRSRNILNDRFKRDLASLSVELGSVEEGDAHNVRPLFVGFNVLFVGTMNEDETTQSLSDKVLDRSNLIRFGKPDLGQTKHPSEGKSTMQGSLTSVDWSSWQESKLAPGDEEQFGSIVERLNDALDGVGRPFGRRVFNAMYRYAANYPAWADKRFECALSDQLEQRILPRLRGLSEDTDEGAGKTLDQVEQVVAEIGDGALIAAFEQARDAPVFHFQGVPRN
ncbi:AAA family ATPase [Haloferula chungangensis]|uniref:AAA family ATPase n=1 Tax=Haloferula chungangensis TaxID=1048331 RepID=A0ABW2L3X2_9BACT